MPAKSRSPFDLLPNDEETSDIAFAPLPESRWLIKGTAQSDDIDGSNASDLIYGLDGDDAIFGVGGNDVLHGGDGDDYLSGGFGHNTIYGENGDDELDSGDVMYGGSGNDEFMVGSRNSAVGGTGDDTFFLYDKCKNVFGGSGTDTVDMGKKIKGYTASYENGLYLIRPTAGSLYDPRHAIELRDSSSIERIAWKDFELDVGHFKSPTITSVYARQTFQSGALIQRSVDSIQGDAPAFSRVRVFCDGVLLGTTTAGLDGRWNLGKLADDAIQGAVELTAVADYGQKKTAHSAGFEIEVNLPLQLNQIRADQGAIYDHASLSTGPAGLLGDINGDGYDDAVVSTTVTGSITVIFGGAGPLGTVAGKDPKAFISLYGKTADPGFDLEVPSDSKLAWTHVSGAGDVNGDGIGDMLLGQTRQDLGNVAIVLLGGTLPVMNYDGHPSVDLAEVAADRAFVIHGGADYTIHSGSMWSAGDVDGDGYGDIVVETEEDAIFVVNGASALPGSVVDGRSTLDLSDLDASDGVRIVGPGALGATVAVGDVNGDGYDDIAVVADEDDVPFYAVLFGKPGGIGSVVGDQRILDIGTMTSSDGFRITDGDNDFGGANSLTSIGDINGDGLDDIAVKMNGRAVVVYGSNDARDIDIGDIAASDGFTLTLESAGSNFLEIAPVGDFNGDGLDDLVVSCPTADVATHKTFLLYGRQSSPGEIAGGRATLELEDVNAALGKIFQTTTEVLVWKAGDLNGDGYDDLMFLSSYNGLATYILYGYDAATSTPVTMAGTSAAEILRGGAGDDTLDGRGGADIFRGGAGDDTIRIGDADVLQIRAGRGMNDHVVFDGAGIVLDGRDLGSSQLSGIEAFDLTGTGDNTLILTAFDVFQLSPNRNGAFSGGLSGNTLVVEGNGGDTLRLIDSSEATWTLVDADVGLDGKAGGDFDIYQLMDGAEVRASVAVSAEISLLH